MNVTVAPAAMTGARARAHTIVVGNEKGGTGKTTSAIHIVVSLLRSNFTVTAIDLDSRQRTFARYIENRRSFVSRTGHLLPLPDVYVVERVKSADATAQEAARLTEILAVAKAASDFIVIDTPGSDTELSRRGHSAADTLLTPMNDSFLDFDLLAKCDPETLEIGSPSLYAEFVWDCRKNAATNQPRELQHRVGRDAEPGFLDRSAQQTQGGNRHRARILAHRLPDRGRAFGTGDLPGIVPARIDRFGPAGPGACHAAHHVAYRGPAGGARVDCGYATAGN